MAAVDDRIAGIISGIYDAAFDSELWPAVLRDITGLVHGNGAGLFFIDWNSRATGPFFSWQLSKESLKLYRAYYHTQDLRLQRGIPGFVNRVFTDRDIGDDSTIQRHPFYQEFLTRFDHPVSGVVAVDELILACSCYRGANQGHAGSAEIAVMEALMPHLRRALRLQQQLTQLKIERQAALEALQKLAQAVLLVTRDGRIAWLNARAGGLLQERDGITARRGKLTCAMLGDGARLARLIGTAAEARLGVATLPGGTMVAMRPSMKRPYCVFVAPLARPAAHAYPVPALADVPMAIVFITDPEQQTAPSAGMLARLHGLTPAEAKLAEAIAGGTSLKEYAEAAGRALSYIRWLLKQVQAKTDTRSQAALVRLLVGQTVPLAMSDQGVTKKTAPPATW